MALSTMDQSFIEGLPSPFPSPHVGEERVRCTFLDTLYISDVTPSSLIIQSFAGHFFFSRRPANLLYTNGLSFIPIFPHLFYPHLFQRILRNPPTWIKLWMSQNKIVNCIYPIPQIGRKDCPADIKVSLIYAAAVS